MRFAAYLADEIYGLSDSVLWASDTLKSVMGHAARYTTHEPWPVCFLHIKVRGFWLVVSVEHQPFERLSQLHSNGPH